MTLSPPVRAATASKPPPTVFSKLLEHCSPPPTARQAVAEPPRVLVLFGSVVLFGAERGNFEALAALKRQGAQILCLISDERWNTVMPQTLDERGFAWRKVGYVYLGKGLSWYTLLWKNPYRFIKAKKAFIRAVREFQPTHIHAYAQS